MVSAISSAHFYSSINHSGASAAGLQAQLSSYQGKLADISDCPSYKNVEGKAKIAELNDKIVLIKAQLTADAKNQSQQSAVTELNVTANTANATNASDTVNSTYSLSQNRKIVAVAAATVGSQVNVLV